MEYSFNSSKIKKLLDAEKKDFKRINLHTSLRDKVQSMIMLYSEKLKSPPHFTKNSEEYFSLLYGKINCLIFNKEGKLVKNISLDQNNNYLILKKNTIHTFKIKSKYAAAHEILQGPFKKNNVYIPSWYHKNESYYKKLINRK